MMILLIDFKVDIVLGTDQYSTVLFCVHTRLQYSTGIPYMRHRRHVSHHGLDITSWAYRGWYPR